MTKRRDKDKRRRRERDRDAVLDHYVAELRRAKIVDSTIAEAVKALRVIITKHGQTARRDLRRI